MKVFISSDMEGTAGVVDWSQCRSGQPEYEYYRTLLQDEVNAAIEQVATAEPPRVGLPATLEMTFRTADLADLATWVAGVERVDRTSAAITADDPVMLFRAFVHVVLLARGIAE